MPTHAQTTMVMLACSATVIIAVVSDLTRGIVPNALTATAAVSGLLYHLFCPGPVEGFCFSFSGLSLGGLLLLAPYCFGFTGAGDVKLQAALGAWIGPEAIGHLFIFSTIAGGIMAMGTLPGCRRHAAKELVAVVWPANRSMATTPTRGLPYALAIGMGYAGHLIWGTCF